MAEKSINQDQFLKNQQIEVEESDFLRNIIEKKHKGIKEEYNLLDVHGRRLSRFWEPGDTISTVGKKRMKEHLRLILNPDTYSKQNYKDVRQYMVRQKVKILGVMITLFFPLSMYYHWVRPNINRVKRMYFMQFYNKMGFFSKELGVKTKPISIKDLKNSL